jgi:hypothetical protein
MKFLNRKAVAASEPPVEFADESLALETGSMLSAPSRWSTAFLMVGSALLGATAIAFWNRRTIANMRSQIQSGIVPITPAKPTDEEIV